MPWKETSVMDEKLRLVAACLEGKEPMTAICERFGVSRETAYKWKRRYAAAGVAGLQEGSRAPHRHGRLTPDDLVERIVAERKATGYGGAKLRAVLMASDPSTDWPAASTITDILKRAGEVAPRGRQRRPIPVEQPFSEVAGPNDTWCIDFKGWFRTQDGERCDPLTVTDAHSRFLLCCQIMEPVTAAVRTAVVRLFQEHGLPRAIRSDNGAPFASKGAAGLTRLSVEWVKLGIRLERIVPGKPQQNGRHERMHRTLKEATAAPPSENKAAQQERFDQFRHRFNTERPHEALGQQPPARHYHNSPRSLPERVLEPWYDADHQIRRVRSTGDVKWQGTTVFISEALAGENIGIIPVEDGHWLARFANIDLGVIDRRSMKLHPFGAARPPCPKRPAATPVSAM